MITSGSFPGILWATCLSAGERFWKNRDCCQTPALSLIHISLLDNGVLNEVSYTVTDKGEQAVCTLTIDGTAYDLAEYIQMHAPVADAFYVDVYKRQIGSHTNVYPLSSVRGVVPANSIYKNRSEVVEKR